MPECYFYSSLRDKILLRFITLAFAVPMLCLIAVSLTMLGCTNNKTGEIQLGGNLIVGMSLDYPPFEAKDGERAYGLDVDLAQRIADKMRKKLVIREIDFAAIADALKNHDIDMAISAISQDSIHDPQIKFSNCYITEGLALLFSKRHKGYGLNLRDFAGKSEIITIGGTSIQRFIEQYQKRHDINLNILYLANIFAALSYIEANPENSIILVDDHVALDIIRKKGYNFSMQKLSNLGYDNYAIALPQDSPLLDEVNEILLELMADGTLDQLRAKWLH